MDTVTLVAFLILIGSILCVLVIGSIIKKNPKVPYPLEPLTMFLISLPLFLSPLSVYGEAYTAQIKLIALRVFVNDAHN